jgi:rubrerythrin
VTASDGIPPEEIWVLSYYRASELAGALLFGRLARRTTDGDLAVFLTAQFAEEARHAWLWTDTLRRLGHRPIPITETYQSRYAREIGLPTSMPRILALTRVFEERIYQHFSLHARRADTHPLVRDTLERMLRDEDGHLDWVRAKLAEYEASGLIDVAELARTYREVDERLYRDVVAYERRLWEFLGMKVGDGSPG